MFELQRRRVLKNAIRYIEMLSWGQFNKTLYSCNSQVYLSSVIPEVKTKTIATVVNYT